jgi:hypothetical protein
MIHKIVVVLDIDTGSYEVAEKIAYEWLQYARNGELMNIVATHVETDFEHDEDGQRVLRLPPEEPLSEEQLLTNRYFSLDDSNSIAEDEERNEIVEKLGYTPSK